jgi:hypothetical protein
MMGPAYWVPAPHLKMGADSVAEMYELFLRCRTLVKDGHLLDNFHCSFILRWGHLRHLVVCHYLTYCSSPWRVDNECGLVRGMRTGKGNRTFSEEMYLSYTLSTVSHTLPDPGRRRWNPELWHSLLFAVTERVDRSSRHREVGPMFCDDSTRYSRSFQTLCCGRKIVSMTTVRNACFRVLHVRFYFSPVEGRLFPSI